jgi:L-threonylcarbamoyladenylate synthase
MNGIHRCQWGLTIYDDLMERSPVLLEVRASQLTASGALRSDHVQAIVDILVDRGGVALIPSDTCYSLAARPTGSAVSRRINRILERREEPISLAFDSVTRVDDWVDLTAGAARLLEGLTPGPLTVVCPIFEGVVQGVTNIADDVLAAPDRTIGVRIPDSRIETQLVTACDYPLTTVAVRTRDRARRAVTAYEDAREIVLARLADLGEMVPLAMVETQQKFYPAHSTVVRAPGRAYQVEYDVIRQGAYATADLDAAIARISRWETQNVLRRGGRR